MIKESWSHSRIEPSFGGPLELGLGCIVGHCKLLNYPEEYSDAEEYAASDGPLGEYPKPTLHPVRLGCLGGLAVDLVTVPVRKPDMSLVCL